MSAAASHPRSPTGTPRSCSCCADCHVPKEWAYKVRRKVAATNELFHKIVGTIDTPEKFEAHRLELARHVWDTMKATDSRECRNCHSAESMALAAQNRLAQRRHEAGAEKGQTCIECPQGIAHDLPAGWDAPAQAAAGPR